MEKRKIIQITMANVEEGEDANQMLVALCDDGSLWKRWMAAGTQVDAWHRVETIAINGIDNKGVKR